MEVINDKHAAASTHTHTMYIFLFDKSYLSRNLKTENAFGISFAIAVKSVVWHLMHGYHVYTEEIHADFWWWKGRNEIKFSRQKTKPVLGGAEGESECV